MKTTNIKSVFDEAVKSFVEKLTQKDTVIGVVLLGGMGKRNFIDQYSDIDIGVFLSKNHEKQYLPPFSFYVQINGREVEFNLSQQIYEDELTAVWGEEKKQAYINGTIAYERGNLISGLLEEKLKRDENMDFARLVELMNQYTWRVNIHSHNTYGRGYPESAHILINDGIRILVEALFILGRVYPPHSKWTFRELSSLKHVTQDEVEFLKDSLLVPSYSLKAIRQRIKSLDALHASTLSKIKSEFPHFPTDPYLYWMRHISNRQLHEIPFANFVIEKLKNILNEADLRKLHGFISYNLVGDIKDLHESLFKNPNHGLSEIVVREIRENLS